MFIEENFVEKHKYDYFAIKYLVKISVDDTNKKTEDILDNYEPLYIRKPYENEEGLVEIRCVRKKNIQEKFMILPTLLRPDEQERDVLYISASSGSGKSYFVNLFAKIYHRYYKKNELFFLTLNDFKGDKSLDHSLYTNLNMNAFIDGIKDNQEAIATDASFMANSLVICDDIGCLKDDKKREKTVWTFIDTLLENKRKAKISLIIISHVPTNYKLTSVLVRECKQYIIFPSNQQVKSDRFLKTYLALSTEQINRICDDEDHSRWVSIDSKKKIVITEYVCYSLKVKKQITATR